MGSKNVPVPLSAMELKVDKNGKPKVFILNVNKEDLEKAPRFSGTSWPDRKQVDDSYRFFGQNPYWAENSGPHGIDISITGHIGRQ